MKQGDVFVVEEQEPLFVVNAVTPNGNVYARKFDIHKGAYGGTEAFPASTEFTILFNSSDLVSFSKVKIGSTDLEDFVAMRKKNFKTQEAKSEKTSENFIPSRTGSFYGKSLEDKLRPGAYSQVGFLGETESLEQVLAQDEQTLNLLGITCENLAAELEKIISEIWKNELERPPSQSQEHDASLDWYSKARNKTFPPIFSLENLPDPNIGALFGNYQVFFLAFMGLQNCPWDCKVEHSWGFLDFLLINRQSGAYVFAPGLIIHLIRAHHFFEGKQSLYRVEPSKLAKVLGFI